MFRWIYGTESIRYKTKLGSYYCRLMWKVCGNTNHSNDYCLYISSQRASVACYSVPSAFVLFTMMIEAVRSSETSVLTRTTRYHIPEDGILYVSSIG
jgi:hypothetical protein